MSVTLSSVKSSARSISFVASTAEGDEYLLMSTVAAAHLTAGGSASDAIYAFLTQSLNTDAAQVAAAVSDAAALVSLQAIDDTTAAYLSYDSFSIYLAGAGQFACRLALAHSAVA